MGKHKNRNRNLKKIENKNSGKNMTVEAEKTKINSETDGSDIVNESVSMLNTETAGKTEEENKTVEKTVAAGSEPVEKASGAENAPIDKKAGAENTLAEKQAASENDSSIKQASTEKTPVENQTVAGASEDTSETDEYEEDEDDDEDDEEPAYNRANVNRIKKMILITIAAMILVPTTIAICLFVKVIKLEKQLDTYKKEAAEQRELNEKLRSASESEGSTAENMQYYSSEESGSLDYQITIYSETKNNLLQGKEADTAELNVIERSSTENVMNVDSVAEKADDVSVENSSEKTSDDNMDTSEAKEEISATEEIGKTVKLNGKKVYLTFDDGPSAYTGDILDILKEKGVKATFFVVAKPESYYPDYQRIVDEGHTLAMHSYSHVYKQVYGSLDDFKYDVESLHQLIYNVTGYDSKVYRFPGGSSNTVASVNIQDCMKYLDEQGYVYFDWNAQNGDAVDYYVTPEELNANVMSYVVNNKGDTVVLMHDLGSHYNTIEALPSLIDQLQSEGYEILPITEDTKPVRHVEYDPAKTTK
ncbi:Peptidoglycan/xylan/chitin deacetylase, PgdA/CDA1 family [Eubacterium ruminantium]|nr:Peptidoglycan/xylan/chitin deacetylase, PgdA/CDA1 family [Eubacterium ruminantium]